MRKPAYIMGIRDLNKEAKRTMDYAVMAYESVASVGVWANRPQMAMKFDNGNCAYISSETVVYHGELVEVMAIHGVNGRRTVYEVVLESHVDVYDTPQGVESRGNRHIQGVSIKGMSVFWDDFVEREEVFRSAAVKVYNVENGPVLGATWTDKERGMEGTYITPYNRIVLGDGNGYCKTTEEYYKAVREEFKKSMPYVCWLTGNPDE